MTDMSMKGFVQGNPGIKYVFFGGKGGVGKTVMAGAAALWFAEQGLKTLLASTNPVHSLTGLLDQDVFGKPTQVKERRTFGPTRSTRRTPSKNRSARSGKRSSGS